MNVLKSLALVAALATVGTTSANAQGAGSAALGLAGGAATAAAVVGAIVVIGAVAAVASDDDNTSAATTTN